MKTTTAKRVALSWLMCSTATLAYAQDDTAFDLGVLRIQTSAAQAVLGNDEITETEIDAEIENTAKKFSLSVDRWLGLLKDERNVTPAQYRTGLPGSRSNPWPA